MTAFPEAVLAAPTTPLNAVRIARVGGTVAEVAAAAISAQALYHLGTQLDLAPAAAWLLSAALDVFAFTTLAVAAFLPPKHPAQRSVLRTARLAFAMTLACNGLDHFLQKAGRLIDPTVRDLLLVAVATLPPIVVERLLNLQSLLVGHGGRLGDHDGRVGAHDGRVGGRGERMGGDSGRLGDRDGRLVGCDGRLGDHDHDHDEDGRDLGEGTLAQNPDQLPAQRVEVAGAEPEPSPMELAKPGRPTLLEPTPEAPRPDWVEIGRGPLTELVAQLGRRPSGREFQNVLVAHTNVLVAAGRLPAGTRPPSVTSAKRIRAALEAGC